MKLTPEQLQRARIEFQAMDTNGDGVISASELQTFVSKITGAPVAMEEIQKIMGEIDTDRNGTIEFNEFIAHQEACTD